MFDNQKLLYLRFACLTVWGHVLLSNSSAHDIPFEMGRLKQIHKESRRVLYAAYEITHLVYNTKSVVEQAQNYALQGERQ